MAQVSLLLEAHSPSEQSITLLVGENRVEFFLGHRYFKSLRDVRLWIDSGWTNHVVAKLLERSEGLAFGYSSGNTVQYCPKDRIPPWLQLIGGSEVSQNYEKMPSKDFSWTVIATTARSLTYNGDRKWFKTKEDAMEFAATVYEGEPKKTFDLAIVQCFDVVRPKSQIELKSSW